MAEASKINTRAAALALVAQGVVRRKSVLSPRRRTVSSWSVREEADSMFGRKPTSGESGALQYLRDLHFIRDGRAESPSISAWRHQLLTDAGVQLAKEWDIEIGE